MKFKVRFKIGNRLGRWSIYTQKEICVSLVDRYSLTDDEINKIFALKQRGVFENEDMRIQRV